MSIEQIQFIKQLFDGKFDKSGEEYWHHCLTVANMARVRADIYKWSKSDCNICYLIGLYHDVIEDTNYSLDKTMETIQQLMVTLEFFVRRHSYIAASSISLKRSSHSSLFCFVSFIRSDMNFIACNSS